MSKVLKVHYVTETDLTSSRVIPTREPDSSVGAESDSSLEAVYDELFRVRRQVEEARTAAAETLERAQNEAAQILAEAQNTATQLFQDERDRGYRQGYADGRLEGLNSCEEEVQTRIAEVVSMVQRAKDHREELLLGLADPLTSITMTAVRKLLARELTVQGPDVALMVLSVLQYVTESTRVEVRVHPSDYAAATQAHPLWQSQKFGDWVVTVVPDIGLEPGGCEIRSEIGRVDVRTETKLELLQEALADVMEQRVRDFGETLE